MKEQKQCDTEWPLPAGLTMRFTTFEDGFYMQRWFKDPSVRRWFPMCDEHEVDDAVGRWISFSRCHCSITALIDGEPCGIATLYLQHYLRIAHQCEFGIIVAPEHRGKGVGTQLLNSLMFLAKNRFKIELLHLQVYAKNPAIRLYRRMGFKEFGVQTHWLKDIQEDEQGHQEVEYVGRIFMERFL